MRIAIASHNAAVAGMRWSELAHSRFLNRCGAVDSDDGRQEKNGGIKKNLVSINKLSQRNRRISAIFTFTSSHAVNEAAPERRGSITFKRRSMSG
jgi:hypothetical protein